jgi:hypothetical protein
MQNTNFRENLDFGLIIILGVVGIVFAIYWNYSHPHMTVKYDCSIAEIHPDYPIAVKEGCRKFRAENNLQKPK